MNDLDWMELHLRCLYHHDENDRIVRTRQPNGWPAPLFHLARTRLGSLWRFRDDLEPGVIRGLARLAGREEPLQEGHPLPQRLQAMRALLRSSADLVVERRGPVYRFPVEIPGDDPRGIPVVAVTSRNQALLEDSFADTIPELEGRQPCFAAVDGVRAVSLCYSARPLEVAGGETCAASEAGVETLVAYRREGLGARVVAAWARQVRELGAEPMYSTEWGNEPSQAVARKLGLILYGEDLSFS